MNGVAFTGSWLPILHLSFLSDVMSRQKRLFPTITKSNSKSQSKQNCYEPRKTVISNNYKIRRVRCKNLRLQSIGWLNNLYNFFLFGTRIRYDWISPMQCILSLELNCLHHSPLKRNYEEAQGRLLIYLGNLYLCVCLCLYVFMFPRVGSTFSNGESWLSSDCRFYLPPSANVPHYTFTLLHCYTVTLLLVNVPVTPALHAAQSGHKLRLRKENLGHMRLLLPLLPFSEKHVSSFYPNTYIEWSIG